MNEWVLKTRFFRQFKTRPTRYLMDPLRASLGNNEFTRLVANEKCMYYNEIKINLCYIHMQIFFENYGKCKVNVKCIIIQYTMSYVQLPSQLVLIIAQNSTTELTLIYKCIE